MNEPTAGTFTLSSEGDGMVRNAVFSHCRTYRYALWRRWAEGDYCMFICLNPSTADEILDDNTVRRCIRYSQAWGYDAFVMTNLFAYRATDPKKMKAAKDPEGDPENLRAIVELAKSAGVVVAAWGVDGAFARRDQIVRSALGNIELQCLARTKDGHPNHPLYLRKDLKPIPLT